MLEDQRLKWKFKRGSDEALTRIYEKYLDSMLTLALGLLHDPAAAEDVVQGVFVAFAQSRRSLQMWGSLSGYLATSVVNRVRDYRRRQRRQSGRVGLAPPEDANGMSWWGKPHPTAAPADVVIFSEEATRLHDAIAQLPEEQREVVLLRLKADMKFRHIAKLQQTSINTVLSRYRYALERLRALLDGEREKWDR
ncbi:MAG: sigma-70 family RNA polymerase sigma factor [Planctomycetes bacterium]|nr:sigma-70 family RNA polymerase sigma factor [Planctomycetota bacterium]